MGQENQTQKTIGFNTVGRKTRPKDHIWTKAIYGIQHSGTGKPDPKDHIWAKTIYGIQHSGTRKPDPKTIGFNTVGTRKPDPKTIYGIQHSWDRETGPKYHIWDSTQWTGKLDPKTIYRILIGKWVALMVAKRMYLVRILLEVGK